MSGSKRYVLEIAYKGTNYAGWQIQPNAHTVQAELEQALKIVFRQEISTVGAGRTDAGVHASQLFVHFDYDGVLPKTLVNSLNGILPPDVAIKGLYIPSNNDFHTRFRAISRAYIYQIVLCKSPLNQDFSMWVRQSLNVEFMNTAAALLLEYEDFASFCKAHGDQKTTLCRMDHAYWEITPDMLRFHIKANRFLRGMVRAIVGSLIWVGTEKVSVKDFQKMIEAKDRRKAGPNAKAKGLILSEVNYPKGTLIEHIF